MRKLTALGTVLLVSGIGTAAYAQDADPPVTEPTPAASDTTDFDRVEVKAPLRAFEIGVQGGYTQPFGEIGDGNDIKDTVIAGGAAGLSLGWRFNPYWSIEGTGQFHESVVGHRFDGTEADVRGTAIGVQGTYHFRPYKRLDPYLSLGGGYRMLWVVPGAAANEMIHGIEVAKAILGLDIRVSPDVALGPMVGADLNVFLWDNPEGATANAAIQRPRPTTFIFAGLGGHFDLGGKRVPLDVARHEEPTPTPAAGPAPQEPPKTAVVIEPKIVDTCKIEGPKAFFEFDKSNLQASAHSALDAVADCFVTGPLKGKHLKIIGRTDPRGTDAYNIKLGQARADSVTEYLTGRGVPKDTVTTITLGESESTGTDESGWAFDRRVDVWLNVTIGE